MQVSGKFDFLYRQLSEAWESHQMLRRSEAAITALAQSSQRLEHAREAMWEWRNCNEIGAC